MGYLGDRCWTAMCRVHEYQDGVVPCWYASEVDIKRFGYRWGLQEQKSESAGWNREMVSGRQGSKVKMEWAKV